MRTLVAGGALLMASIAIPAAANPRRLGRNLRCSRGVYLS